MKHEDLAVGNVYERTSPMPGPMPGYGKLKITALSRSTVIGEYLVDNMSEGEFIASKEWFCAHFKPEVKQISNIIYVVWFESSSGQIHSTTYHGIDSLKHFCYDDDGKLIHNIRSVDSMTFRYEPGKFKL